MIYTSFLQNWLRKYFCLWNFEKKHWKEQEQTTFIIIWTPPYHDELGEGSLPRIFYINILPLYIPSAHRALCLPSSSTFSSLTSFSRWTFSLLRCAWAEPLSMFDFENVESWECWKLRIALILFCCQSVATFLAKARFGGFSVCCPVWDDISRQCQHPDPAQEDLH